VSTQDKRHVCGHTQWHNDRTHYLIAVFEETAPAPTYGYTAFYHSGFRLMCSQEKMPGVWADLRSLDYSPLGGFRVTCQSDSDGLSRADEPRTQPYGWEYGIERSGPVTLEAMENALPYLRKVAAKLEKINAEAGNAASYGAYCQRIAVALGVRSFVKNHKPNSGWAHDLTRDLRSFETKDIAWVIDNAHTAWSESVKLVKQTV